MTAKTKPAPDPKPTPLEVAQEADDLDFWEQWGELGPGKQVEVNREPGRIYLAQVPLDEDFGPDLIQERWGGGKFSFRARENGRFIKGLPARHIMIEGEPKIQKLPQVVEDTPEVMALRKKLEELTGTQLQPAKAATDSIMVAVVGMVTPLLTALVTQAMDRPAQASPLEMFDVYRKLAKDARREAGPGSNGELDPLKDLGLPLLTEIREMRKIEAGKNGAVSNGSEPTKPTDPTEAPAPRLPSTMQELAEFVATYCAPHVARGASPSLRAEVLLEDLALQNQPLLAQVVNLANLDNVLEHWASMVPSVAAAKEWHGEFISDVRRFSDEPTEGSDDNEHPEGGPGDTGDGEADGTPSETGGEV